MRIIAIMICCFLVGLILGGGLERDELKAQKRPLVMLLKKNGKIDTVKIEVDTFKYYQP